MGARGSTMAVVVMLGAFELAIGSWVAGFMGNGRQRMILQMELSAIFTGLHLAWEKQFRRIVCYSDSLMAVELVLHPPRNTHAHAGLIARIRKMLRRNWVVRVAHTLRKGSTYADFLAKAGAQHDLDFCVVE